MRKGILIGLMMVTSLVGCGVGENGEYVSALAKDIEYIMNLRYTGYKEGDKEVLERVLADDIVEEVESRFNASKDDFVSLEGIISSMESDIVIEESDTGDIVEYNLNQGYTDERIYKNEKGERGVNISDVYVEGNRFSIEILGNNIAVDIPDGLELRSYEGNPSYKLSVLEYNMYDDGTFILSLGTDLEGAFKDRFSGLKIVSEGDEQELYGDIESLDGTQEIRVTDKTYNEIYNVFMYTYDTYEIKIMLKVGQDGKVSDISIDNILGVLGSNE